MHDVHLQVCENRASVISANPKNTLPRRYNLRVTYSDDNGKQFNLFLRRPVTTPLSPLNRNDFTPVASVYNRITDSQFWSTHDAKSVQWTVQGMYKVEPHLSQHPRSRADRTYNWVSG